MKTEDIEFREEYNPSGLGGCLLLIAEVIALAAVYFIAWGLCWLVQNGY